MPPLDRGGHRTGCVERRHVAGLGQHLHPRPRPDVPQPPGLGHGCHAVPVSHKDVAGDAGQHVGCAQLGVLEQILEEALVGGQCRLLNHVRVEEDDGPRDRAEVEPHRQHRRDRVCDGAAHPFSEARQVVHHPLQLLPQRPGQYARHTAHCKRLHGGGDLHAASPRELPRMPAHQRERHRPAEGVPNHHHRPADAACAEDGRDVVGGGVDS